MPHTKQEISPSVKSIRASEVVDEILCSHIDEEEDLKKSDQDKECSINCPSKNCFSQPREVIEKVSEILRLPKSKFHGFLLQKLARQSEMGMDIESFFVLMKHKFCLNSMRSSFGVSKYILATVISEHKEGKLKYKPSNIGTLYRTDKKDKVIAMILHFSKTQCENLPDRQMLQLPLYMTVNTIFKYYEENCSKEMQVGEREFYRIFKTCFANPSRVYPFLPRVVFQPKNSHPKCNECRKLYDLKVKYQNQELDRTHIESLQKIHQMAVRRKYMNFTYRRELAVRQPKDYLHVRIDDMSQNKVNVPRVLNQTNKSGKTEPRCVRNPSKLKFSLKNLIF